MTRVNIATGIISFFVCAQAIAQVHVTDIIIRNTGGVIETGLVDTGGMILYGERVFLGVFGELPNWTNDPGFDSESAALPSGTTLYLDIVDAAREWDGSEFVTIPEERIQVTKSGNSVLSPTTSQTVSGPVLGSTKRGWCVSSSRVV